MIFRNQRSGILFVILLSLCAFRTAIVSQSSFYEALSGSSEMNIDQELKRLDSEKHTSQSQAYRGALLMKKAGYLKGVGHKVKMFKSGALLLEEEIKNYPQNAEYRFIRLSIQENAPKILKYNKNLQEDRKMVVDGYKNMETGLKKVVRNYASGSKVLNVDDLS